MEFKDVHNKLDSKIMSTKYKFAEPDEFYFGSFAQQKLEYTHYNADEAGFVDNPEEWLYSSERL